MQILHAVDHAGIAKAPKQADESLPVIDPRHRTVIGIGGEKVKPRAGKAAIGPVEPGRCRVQRDKMRHEARQAVQKINGIIAVLTPHVHVLAEDRRLLRQITKVLDGFPVARAIADLLALPALKRMRSAAADLYVMAGGGTKHRLLNRAQLRRRLVDVAADAGGDLQHAFGNVMLGLARFQRALDLVNQRGRVLA